MFLCARRTQPSFALPSAHQIKKRPEARDEGEVVGEISRSQSFLTSQMERSFASQDTSARFPIRRYLPVQ